MQFSGVFHETEKTQNFLGVVYGGKDLRGVCQNMCQTLNNEREIEGGG